MRHEAFSLDLLIVGYRFPPEMADQDWREAMDAAQECRHGRLPHDKTDPCGCWPGEPAVIVKLPTRITNLEKAA